ncbi:hypothetical protein MSAS_38270 [Mycobacterium saskatchewanense]|uniref:Secreted protein n=1 Tax=Mycobacterium saskatchewanense TaxID=220927 RepID=A0AAJ3NRX1_9MYCO|nr:DUF2613 domain-containing protein [Mycobacterium saskatchewanense]ORW73391.1 hypothetical protein AWC23_07375 [Mycobacterium saskatchewanense]BBX64653.1 hypothetical protein MSAS_38270 [Mycobacterium saskatchewanense]
MSGVTLAAAASIAVGLSLGAAATVGVTLASDSREDHGPAPARQPPAPAGPNMVDYGDRCFHGHCLPCDSKESCLSKLPPELRP